MLFLHLLKGSDGSYLYFINVVYHIDITSHLSEWLKSTTQETTGIDEDVEKGEPSCPVGGNANWCSHSGKQYGGSSKS